MAFSRSKLHDPRTYTKALGKQLKNYNYSVIVNRSVRGNDVDVQFITVSSNEVLTEEQILSTAEVLTQRGGKSGQGGEVIDMQIDDAIRSQSLGEA